MGDVRGRSRKARTLGLAVGVVFMAAATAAAQSPLTVRVSPLIGYGNFVGAVRAVPDASVPSLESIIHFDANFVAGLSAEVSWGGLPLRLRGGASRTLAGNLNAFSGWESCGYNCSKALYSDVASAAATTLWGDLVLSPLSTSLAPYAFLGLARRIMSYGNADAAIAPYLDSHDHHSMARFGAGVELNIAPRGVYWLEVAKHRTSQSLGQHVGTGVPLWSPSDTQLAMGLKLRLF